MESKMSSFTQSYVHNPLPLRFAGDTISDNLDQSVEMFPDKEAFVFPAVGVRITFRNFKQQVDIMASKFLQLAVEIGDCVGIWAGTCLEWLISFYAAAKVGARVAQFQVGFTSQIMERLLNVTKCKILVNSKGDHPSVDLYEIISELESCEVGTPHVQTRFPSFQTVIEMDEDGKQGSLSFQQILTTGYVSEKELQARQHQVCSDNILSLYFTSGSTGFPKCVVHTHHTQINSQRASNTREKCSKARELLASSDLAHIGAIRAILFPGLFGTTSIFLPPKYSIENTMRMLQDECITRTRLRPNVLFDVINHPHFNEYNLQSLETVFTGGYLVPESIMKLAESALGCHVVDDYGSTEMIDGLFSEVYGVSSEEMLKYPNCMYPTPGNEIKVVDAGGNIVTVNTIGELWVRSPFLFLYYLDDKEATNKVKTSDGWFKSGDLVSMNEDGWCKIVGRLNDMIIREGINIYPSEIEMAIALHPKVSQVQVVAIPDEKVHQRVCICIITKNSQVCTEEEILKFCHGRIHAAHIPDHVIFVKEFPKTFSNKLDRRQLAKVAEEKLFSKK
ncbi:medium-chain acyl-CoA ligase ACSF2, mitochondrial-like [Ptychodera flava]|uniref:medium-chain acyl-CoA ligase ACSF2, mitochondrial-like n=1 Tax=Ptychodera flava TaxID=63121 RepID=UPI003969EBA9